MSLVERVLQLDQLDTSELESILSSKMLEVISTLGTALEPYINGEEDRTLVVGLLPPAVKLALRLAARDRDLLIVGILTLEFKVTEEHGETCMQAFSEEVHELGDDVPPMGI